MFTWNFCLKSSLTLEIPLRVSRDQSCTADGEDQRFEAERVQKILMIFFLIKNFNDFLKAYLG